MLNLCLGLMCLHLSIPNSSLAWTVCRMDDHFITIHQLPPLFLLPVISLDEQRNTKGFDGPTISVSWDFHSIIKNVTRLPCQAFDTCFFPICMRGNFVEFLAPWFSFLPFLETVFLFYFLLQPLSFKSEALKNSQLHPGKLSLLRISINGWFFSHRQQTPSVSFFFGKLGVFLRTLVGNVPK